MFFAGGGLAALLAAGQDSTTQNVRGLHLNMHDDLLLALCFFVDMTDCIHLSPEEVLVVTKKRNKIPELCNLSLA